MPLINDSRSVRREHSELRRPGKRVGRIAPLESLFVAGLFSLGSATPPPGCARHHAEDDSKDDEQ